MSQYADTFLKRFYNNLHLMSEDDMPSDDLIEKLKAALGQQAVLTRADAAEGAVGGRSARGVPAVLPRPASTAGVSAARKLCHAAGEAVVPWGGKTGLVDGAEANRHIALSLERRHRIEEIDEAACTM